MKTGSYRALLVGNAVFTADPHNLPPLVGPPNDLDLLNDSLTHPTFGLFHAEDVVVLLDRKRDEIERTIEETFNLSGPDDVVFLYYSGHGVMDRRNHLYICAQDTMVDRLVTTAVSDATINGIIDNSPVRSTILMLDCCNSGAISWRGSAIPETLVGPGRHLITSTHSRQLAADTIGGQPGPSPFTRFVADGLVSGALDSDGDGYVVLHDLFRFVHDRLAATTKQNPLYMPSKEGDIAIARARETAEPASEDRPVLRLDPTSIDIRDAMAGEALPVEVVHVLNEGGGELHWSATCDADWVELVPDGDRLRLTLHPPVGRNRAIVSVADAGRGGAQTVRLTVFVAENAPERRPVLRLSESSIDFGIVSVGGEEPRRTVVLHNDGGGDLLPSIASVDPGIDAVIYGSDLSIVLLTSEPRTVDGKVQVVSSGGTAVVNVRGRVRGGPVVSVAPRLLDFGKVRFGEHPSRRATVTNVGSGALRWAHSHTSSFFTAERIDDDEIVVTLDGTPGSYRGALRIESDGGDATVDVKARIVPASAGGPRRRRRVIATLAVAALAIAGTIVGLRSQSSDDSSDGTFIPLSTTAASYTTVTASPIASFTASTGPTTPVRTTTTAPVRTTTTAPRTTTTTTPSPSRPNTLLGQALPDPSTLSPAWRIDSVLPSGRQYQAAPCDTSGSELRDSRSAAGYFAISQNGTQSNLQVLDFGTASAATATMQALLHGFSVRCTIPWNSNYTARYDSYSNSAYLFTLIPLGADGLVSTGYQRFTQVGTRIVDVACWGAVSSQVSAACLPLENATIANVKALG